MSDKSEESLRLRGHIVISTTLEGDKKYAGCKVIEFGEIYPAIYRQVYGPDSERECEKWVKSNCSWSATS